MYVGGACPIVNGGQAHPFLRVIGVSGSNAKLRAMGAMKNLCGKRDGL